MALLTPTLLTGALALLVAIKGLGGSFTCVFAGTALEAYHGPIVGFILGGLLIVFFLVYAFDRRPAVVPTPATPRQVAVFLLLFFILFGAAAVVRVKAIRERPIDIGYADMLPTVQAALNDVVHGRQPYRAHALADGRVIPHCYLPALWLPYLPFYAAGVDIRYWNIAAQLLAYLLLLDCFFRGGRFGFRRFDSAALLFLGVVALHVFSKQMIRQVTDLHTASFWLFYSLFLWALLRGKLRAAICLAPVVVLCREPAVVLLLPILVYFRRIDRHLFRQALELSILIGLAIAGPFLWLAGWDFFGGVRIYSAMDGFSVWPEMVRYYGISGLMKKWGLMWLQRPVQIGAVGASALAALTAPIRDLGSAAALGGAAYVAFMLVISISAPYVYTEPLLLAFFLFVAGRGADARVTPGERTRSLERPEPFRLFQTEAHG